MLVFVVFGASVNDDGFLSLGYAGGRRMPSEFLRIRDYLGEIIVRDNENNFPKYLTPSMIDGNLFL